MHDVRMIVLTGGPCGGKTTLTKQVCALLEQHHIRAVVLGETATELFGAGFSPSLVGNETFQRHILEYSLAREDLYVRMAHTLPPLNETVIICDRGVLDGIAYIGRSEFGEIARSLGYSLSELMHRYTMVIHLVTAADGAEQYYTLENNAARSETVEAARVLDKRTQAAWHGHPHHFIIDNSTSFDEKMRRAVQAFGRMLKMPEALEIERKFVVNNFHERMLPEDAERERIVQTYLVPVGNVVRRVRRIIASDGKATHTHTEKKPTGNPGENIENEDHIPRSKYLKFLSERDPTKGQIVKDRYHFTYANRHFELDVYDGPLHGLVVLEVELRDMSEHVVLPEGWELTEVTGDDSYSNFMLANMSS